MEYKLITLQAITGLNPRYKAMYCYTSIPEPTRSVDTKICLPVGAFTWYFRDLILKEIGLIYPFPYS